MEVTRPAIPTTKTMRVEPVTRAKDAPTEAASVDTEVATMDPVTTKDRLSSMTRSQGTTTTVAKDRTVAIGRTTAAPALPATTTTELRTAVATKDKTTEVVISTTTTVACPVAAKAKKGNLSSSVSLENPVSPVKVVKNIEAEVVAAETGEREALQPQLLLRPLPL